MPGDLSVSQLMVSVDYPGTVGDHLVLIDFEEFGTFDPNSHLACLREGQFDVLRFQFNTEWISSRVRTEELGLTLELGKAMLTKLNAMMQHTLDVLDLAALMGILSLEHSSLVVIWIRPTHLTGMLVLRLWPLSLLLSSDLPWLSRDPNIRVQTVLGLEVTLGPSIIMM